MIALIHQLCIVVGFFEMWHNELPCKTLSEVLATGRLKRSLVRDRKIRSVDIQRNDYALTTNAKSKVINSELIFSGTRLPLAHLVTCREFMEE